jgi:phage baseplate assembly protein gpV
LNDRRVYGFVIGIVKDLEDPSGQGRIRLQFPWFDPDVLSGWAPIVRTLAGKDRGFYYMPELEDEALVGFEHGDFRMPFVVGFLHNGVDLPPDDDIDVSVRRIKTVSGHVLEFDDRPDRELVRLETQGGHHVEMEDSPGTVEIATSGGQKIVMSDRPASIELSTKSGATVKIDDVPSSIRATTAGGISLLVTDSGGVTVSAPTGALTITCLSATITASASCTVNAPVASLNGAAVSVNSGIATFSGIVQCATLITNSVVSASYTPGAGNLW